jgi:hypothetical protein
LAVAVIAVAAVLIVAIRSRAAKAREDRRERARHEEFLHGIHRACIDMRDVEPYAAYLADEVRTHLANNKEIR